MDSAINFSFNSFQTSKNFKHERDHKEDDSVEKDTQDTRTSSDKQKLQANTVIKTLISFFVGLILSLVLPKIMEAFMHTSSNNINNEEIANLPISIDSYGERKTYWVYTDGPKPLGRNSCLKHVHLLLERVGYRETSNETNVTSWNLLWAYQYPFGTLNLRSLKPDQLVNHFPASSYISAKYVLATTPSEYIPKAFNIPRDKQKFLAYAKNNSNAMFVEKHINHREVVLKNVSDIDFTNKTKFVQEYIQKPFLVDGHKFDIGVYVVITSVNPLRVYWYKGDAIFR